MKFCTRSKLAISNVSVKFKVYNSKTVEFRNFVLNIGKIGALVAS